MIVTLVKRYDENGAWTHDMDVMMGVITPDSLRNSQWKVDEYIDIKELKECNETLEEECENLTAENTALKLRLSVLQHQN
jgi:hypothetical protein